MGKKVEFEVEGRKLQLSNLEKVMFPATGFTKADVINYYIRVGPFILPHLKNRPLTLKRFPDGIEGPHFYEKDAPSHTPDWVDRAIVPRKEGGPDIHFVLLNDLPSLVWAANLACLEMHTFLARAPKVNAPTMIVFDLDPGPPANALACAQVACWLRKLLDDLGVKSFVKSSGSKGLQLYAPLNTPARYEKTQPFARQLAEQLERDHPELVVSKMAKDLRQGKVFIDWSQNSNFKTTVAVYSLRAKRPEPYVSVPLAWTDVEKALKSRKVDLFYVSPAAMVNRLEKDGDCFKPILTLKQKLPRL